MLSANRLVKLSVDPSKRYPSHGMNCIFALHAKNIQSCLKLKDINIDCPPKCPFFVKGKPGHYQEALDKHIDIDCLYCTRKKDLDQLSKDEWVFFCSLTVNPNPFCRMCLFAKYKVDFSPHHSLI